MATTLTFNRLLEPGDPAPWLPVPVVGVEGVTPFDKFAGRHVLLFLFGSARLEPAAAGLAQVAAAHRLFADERATFLGVGGDAGDVAAKRLPLGLSNRFFADDRDGAISRAFGAAPASGAGYRPHWLLLDPALRVTGRFALTDAAGALAALDAALCEPLPELAPVLAVPNLLEPAFCRQLIALYEQHGGTDSGIMRQVGGRTVGVIDHQYKRRADYDIADEAVCTEINRRIHRRLVPMIKRAFQFDATRIERYIVACYDAADGGHFNPHRDNTTTGTAHRRFAVTINLNDEYDGGDLRFPEFGPRLYRAPLGGAVVFSCSLQHEATRVTRGRRYATLPFLYDEAAAVVRDANRHTLQPAATAATATATVA